jgi:Rieske Fe-S protein
MNSNEKLQRLEVQREEKVLMNLRIQHHFTEDGAVNSSPLKVEGWKGRYNELLNVFLLLGVICQHGCSASWVPGQATKSGIWESAAILINSCSALCSVIIDPAPSGSNPILTCPAPPRTHRLNLVPPACSPLPSSLAHLALPLPGYMET